MSLEAAIHQRWADDAALVALLPAQRFRTGRTSAGPRPHAALTVVLTRPVLRSNADDTLDECDVAIDVWHDEHDAGRAIAERVAVSFDRAAFDLPEGGRAVQMRRTAGTAAQDEEGVWRFRVVFIVEVHRAGEE